MQIEDRWKKLARRMVKKAGERLKEGFGKEQKVLERTEGDIKIEEDRRVERELIEMVEESDDDFSILTEERGEIGDSDLKWVMDPLDGTVNYYYGTPFFVSTVTLKHKNELLLTAVYDPLRDELFYSERSNGAFLNGEPIHVSDRYFQESVICMAAVRETENFDILKKLSEIGNRRKLGSGVLSLAYVASGRIDAYLNFHTKPWDIASGILLVREAGGKITDLQGKETNLNGGDFLLSNGKIHEEILKRL